MSACCVVNPASSLTACVARSSTCSEAAQPAGFLRKGSAPKSKGRTLSFWCFKPGVAMADLKALGVRSIILTRCARARARAPATAVCVCVCVCVLLCT